MTIPQVNENLDTVSVLTLVINQVAQLEGDLTLLNTLTKTDLVSAINEVLASNSSARAEAEDFALMMDY